jgi:hypothetical protein
MKRLFIFIIAIGSSYCLPAQDGKSEKIMEQRAKEMHRVITLNDKEAWKKFVRENYAQSLIDKPMQAKIQQGEQSKSEPTNTGTPEENLEGKAKMFQRLHDDFGTSHIISLKPKDEDLDMILADTGIKGTFHLKFAKTKPYLIEGLGIEVSAGER